MRRRRASVAARAALAVLFVVSACGDENLEFGKSGTATPSETTTPAATETPPTPTPGRTPSPQTTPSAVPTPAPVACRHQGETCLGKLLPCCSGGTCLADLGFPPPLNVCLGG